MHFSLRRRILLLFLPAALFLFAVGVGGVLLLDNLGRRSEEIIRENFVSLKAMYNLHQSLTDLERIVLWTTREEAIHPEQRAAFKQAAKQARDMVDLELETITVPGEQEQADTLKVNVDRVLDLGEKLLDAPARSRWELYLDPDNGFQHTVTLAWQRLSAVWQLNEDAMYDADRAARRTARRSVVTLSLSVGLCLILTAALGWWLQRTILGPIRAVTDAATAIGGGQLHLMVPVETGDEVGRLAEAFNAMSAKLRSYRQTDTERLLRARRTGQATIDSFPDPVVVIDTLGRIESANPAAQRVLGVRPPEDGEDRVHWSPPESLRIPVENALTQQRPVLAESFEQAVTFRLDGDEHSYFPQVRPIRSPEGELLGAAIVLNDVTRFRLLDRLKSDWVATVSHELKTPLTGVRLAVHVLLEEVIGPLEPKQVELLVEARDNTERLLKLIEHLLALARLEDGREELDLKPTDPVALLRAAADEASSRAEDKRIDLVIDDAPDLPAIVVDSVRLGRALNNLIDNAITYTEPGGKVTLTASKTDTNRVRLSVGDTGMGIPPEYLPHVFDRFFRVPGRDSKPGTGLGLAIVHDIVAAHRGTIECVSEVGVGTRFDITLPAGGQS